MPELHGADLANLANEAALTATRRRHERVRMRDFTDALERIVLGAERKILMTSDDRRRTAYHEAGHAVVGMLTPGADPVRKVSIIPRGQALGVTFSAPERDREQLDTLAHALLEHETLDGVAAYRAAGARAPAAIDPPAPRPASPPAVATTSPRGADR